MNIKNFNAQTLRQLFMKQKIVTMSDLQKSINTNSRMTVYRYLEPLNYISSYSNSGKYYALRGLSRFNKYGICRHESICFCKEGTLKELAKRLVEESSSGFVASELQEIVTVKVDDVLLELLRDKLLVRDKLSNEYVYFSKPASIRREQQRRRREALAGIVQPSLRMHELKAAIILFFTLLNEKQKRLYSGLESLKIGYGGDSQIAALLGVSEATVAKGRKEILREKIDIESTRKPGGGRKKVEKKDRTIIDRIEMLMKYETAGDPMSGMKWTRKTTEKISD